MNLIELTVVSILVGALASLPLQSFMRTIEKAKYTEAVINIGTALKSQECEQDKWSNGNWDYQCVETGDVLRVWAIQKGTDRKAIGAIAEGIPPLICRGSQFLSDGDLLSGYCPNPWGFPLFRAFQLGQ
jgi:type II secretory pathway pseudopilin PulG